MPEISRIFLEMFNSSDFSKNSKNIFEIKGVGIDLLSIDRVNALYQRYNKHFLEKMLGYKELDIFRKRFSANYARGIRFLATRIASKEAFSKAVGTGMRYPLTWKNIQIINADKGAPEIYLSHELDLWYRSFYGDVHISISDDSNLAIAIVLVGEKY